MRPRTPGTRAVAALLVGLATPWLSGCSSSTSLGEGEIVGRWVWLSSTGGIAGTTRSPASEGYSGVLRFAVDGTAEWRIDGELRWSTTWTLGVAPEGHPLAGETVVRYGQPVVGWEQQAVRFPGPGRLTLVDPCCDGFVHEYEAAGGP